MGIAVGPGRRRLPRGHLRTRRREAPPRGGLQRRQPPILTRACDVADRADVGRLAAWAVQELGRLDIVVNSAGINVARRKMCELDPADFDRVLAINCTGFYNLLWAVLARTCAQRRDGLIVSISSIAGKRAVPLAGPAYAASKFAATALATAVGLEERPNGIRITNICPGEVDTPILEQRPVPVPAEQRPQMVHPAGHRRLRGGDCQAAAERARAGADHHAAVSRVPVTGEVPRGRTVACGFADHCPPSCRRLPGSVSCLQDPYPRRLSHEHFHCAA